MTRRTPDPIRLTAHLRLRARVLYDDCPPELGTYTNRPTGFAFRRSCPGRNEYRYFQPENDPAEAERWYRANGESRGPAHAAALANARADYDRAEAYTRGDIFNFGLVIELTDEAGHELGSASLFGMESDFYTDRRAPLHAPGALAATAADLIGEACTLAALAAHIARPLRTLARKVTPHQIKRAAHAVAEAVKAGEIEMEYPR